MLVGDNARILFLSILHQIHQQQSSSDIVANPLSSSSSLMIFPFFHSLCFEWSSSRLLQWLSSLIVMVPNIISSNPQLIFLLLQHVFLLGILLISTCCQRMLPKNASVAKLLTTHRRKSATPAAAAAATTSSDRKQQEDSSSGQKSKQQQEDSQKAVSKQQDDSQKQSETGSKSWSIFAGATKLKASNPLQQASPPSFSTSILSSQDSSRIFDSVHEQKSSEQRQESEKKNKKAATRRGNGEESMENSFKSEHSSAAVGTTSTKKQQKSSTTKKDSSDEKIDTTKSNKNATKQQGDESMTDNTVPTSATQSMKDQKNRLKAMPGSARSPEWSLSKKKATSLMTDSTLPNSPSRDAKASSQGGLGGKQVAGERDFVRKMMEDERKKKPPVEERVSSSEQFISGLKYRRRKSGLNKNYEPPANSLKLSLDVEMLEKGENRVNSLKPDPPGSVEKLSSHKQKIEAMRTMCQYVIEICTGVEVDIDHEGKVDKGKHRSRQRGSASKASSTAPDSKNHHAKRKSSSPEQGETQQRLSWDRKLKKRFSSPSYRSNKQQQSGSDTKHHRRRRKRENGGESTATHSDLLDRATSQNSSLLSSLLHRRPSPVLLPKKTKSRSLSITPATPSGSSVDENGTKKSAKGHLSRDSATTKDQPTQRSISATATRSKTRERSKIGVMEIIPTPSPKTQEAAEASSPKPPDILVHESAPPPKASFLRTMFKRTIKNSSKASDRKKSDDPSEMDQKRRNPYKKSNSSLTNSKNRKSAEAST